MSVNALDSVEQPGIMIGVYGKLPCAGDFFYRHLSASTLEALDRFHAQSLYELQKTYANQWQERFLHSAAWCCYIPRHCWADSSFLGVIVPSCDRVGRAYPLTLLLPLTPALEPMIFALPFERWLKRSQSIIQAGLEQQFSDTDAFFQALSATTQILGDWFRLGGSPPSYHRLTFQQPWTPSDAIAFAWASEHCSHRSIWWRYPDQGTGQLHYFDGLPLAQQYAELLDADVSLGGATVQLPVDSLSAGKLVEPEPQSATDPAKPVLSDAHSATLLPQQAEMPMQEAYLSADYHDPLSNVALLGGSEVTPSYSAQATVFSEIGHVRKQNEDAYLCCSESGLWLVADGMGGLSQGGLASQMIVDWVKQIELQGDIQQRSEQLCQQIRQANHSIFTHALKQGCRCGSTVVALVQYQTNCAVVWAGDSRLYRFRAGQLMQMTQDHSPHSDMLQHRSVINRAIGPEAEVDLDCHQFAWQLGDRFLLCSDGVYNFIEPAALQNCMAIDSLQGCVDAIEQQVLAGAARDNLTAIVVDMANSP